MQRTEDQNNKGPSDDRDVRVASEILLLPGAQKPPSPDIGFIYFPRSVHLEYNRSLKTTSPQRALGTWIGGTLCKPPRLGTSKFPVSPGLCAPALRR